MKISNILVCDMPGTLMQIEDIIKYEEEMRINSYVAEDVLLSKGEVKSEIEYLEGKYNIVYGAIIHLTNYGNGKTSKVTMEVGIFEFEDGVFPISYLDNEKLEPRIKIFKDFNRDKMETY